jgi:hypothetical protein
MLLMGPGRLVLPGPIERRVLPPGIEGDDYFKRGDTAVGGETLAR